jgi:hypothetical protein
MEGVVFNLKRLRARDLKTLASFNAIDPNADAITKATKVVEQYDRIAALFSRVIVECPAEWGDPTNPDTFLDLEVETFNGLIADFGKQQAGDTKN